MTQKEALDILKLGKNVFLTGAAGSGKTHLMNQYIDYLYKHSVPMAVTASTGIAATHIGGQTIHSWSGIGIRDSADEGEMADLAAKSHVKRNWRRAKVLIIDEVSMLHGHQLEMIDMLGRNILDSEKPFGGLQVVLSGDFFQLPPVSSGFRGGSGVSFAYECSAWENGEFQICYLEEQFRQADDDLLKVLNDIRTGQAGEHTRVPLRSRYNKDPEGNVEPTRLFARNVNVDSVNAQALDKIPGEVVEFEMETKGFQKLVDGLKRSCLAPETLRLKKGAEVMFIKNAPDGKYVNGTRGVVETFDPYDGWPIVRTQDDLLVSAEPEEWRLEENGTVRATLTQVPLRLAWAITVHKSQGMTLDVAEMDLSDAFEPGMGYVALSRVRSLSGLKLLGLNDVALSVNPKVLSHDKKFKQWSDKVRDVMGEYSDEDKKTEHEKVLFDRFEGLKEGEASKKSKKSKGGRKSTKIPTHEVTKSMLLLGRGVEEIATDRGLTVGTVINHMEKLHGLGDLPDVTYMTDSIGDFKNILKAFKKSDDGKLTPIFKQFEGEYSFDTLKLVRLFAK